MARAEGGAIVQVVVVSQSEVPTLLPMRECLRLMERTLAALSAGTAIAPLRTVMWLPDRTGLLGMMPAYLSEDAGPGVFGLKAISVFPGNHGTEFDAHQGAVLLFEATHGRLLAVIDATAITAIRTAAVSGVATRYLARADAGDLAILGSGTQARAHLDAMHLARPLRRVRVWSRTPARAARFAEVEGARYGLAVEAVASAQDAVLGADLICTATSSAEPVLRGAWLAPGAHINAVGSSVPFARELDTAAVARSRMFVDRRESAVNEAGDFLLPKQEGAVGDEHIQGEIGDVILGRIAGRRDPDEITLFKSLGLAVEDVASAHHIYTQAHARGLGARITLGGRRDPA